MPTESTDYDSACIPTLLLKLGPRFELDLPPILSLHRLHPGALMLDYHN